MGNPLSNRTVHAKGGANLEGKINTNKKTNIIKTKEIESLKSTEVRKEFNKMKKIYNFLPKDTFKLNEYLIKNAAFMAVSLSELQVAIDKKGYTEEYQNGKNQMGLKKISEVDIYNTMIKNYTATIKMLNELLPKNAPVTDDAEALLKFAAR